MPESLFIYSALLAIIGFAVWIIIYLVVIQRKRKSKRYRYQHRKRLDVPKDQ